MKKITSSITLVFLLFTAFMQAQGTIRGTVVDGENGTPLPGVNVVVEGTTNGVSTDFDGVFEIQVVDNAGSLRVSYVGFKPSTLAFDLSGKKVIDLGITSNELLLPTINLSGYKALCIALPKINVST